MGLCGAQWDNGAAQTRDKRSVKLVHNGTISGQWRVSTSHATYHTINQVESHFGVICVFGLARGQFVFLGLLGDNMWFRLARTQLVCSGLLVYNLGVQAC